MHNVHRQIMITRVLLKLIYNIMRRTLSMKVEIEFKKGAVNVSKISQKLSTILNSVKQQGLDAKEFELEISTGSTNDVSQATQKISSVVSSIKEQGFDVKELEVESEKDE